MSPKSYSSLLQYRTERSMAHIVKSILLPVEVSLPVDIKPFAIIPCTIKKYWKKNHLTTKLHAAIEELTKVEVLFLLKLVLRQHIYRRKSSWSIWNMADLWEKHIEKNVSASHVVFSHQFCIGTGLYWRVVVKSFSSFGAFSMREEIMHESSCSFWHSTD